MIHITEPFLPPVHEYTSLLQEIWHRKWVTNNGPLVQQLEQDLNRFLGTPHISYVNNGTIALQLAIKALDLSGEIITTPYSYIASTSSIIWENCQPVFVDIEEHTFNIDPRKIEEMITPNTTAILAVHIFGNPCNTEALQKIADKYRLKLIYDAAHSFGVTYKGQSIFTYGDISTTSFHATKLFHTIEGGALFTRDSQLAERITQLRNFGMNSSGMIEQPGINAKSSELHAAIGICNLRYIEELAERRKQQWLFYEDALAGIDLQLIRIQPETEYNYAYFPAVFPSEALTRKALADLAAKNIGAKRYFYPSLNTLPFVPPAHCPIAQSISERALCLPLFHRMDEQTQETVTRTIKNTIMHRTQVTV